MTYYEKAKKYLETNGANSHPVFAEGVYKLAIYLDSLDKQPEVKIKTYCWCGREGVTPLECSKKYNHDGHCPCCFGVNSHEKQCPYFKPQQPGSASGGGTPAGYMPQLHCEHEWSSKNMADGWYECLKCMATKNESGSRVSNSTSGVKPKKIATIDYPVVYEASPHAGEDSYEPITAKVIRLKINEIINYLNDM